MSVKKMNACVTPASSNKQIAADEIDNWIFDLDNTLYPAGSLLFDQVDERIGRYIAEKFHLEWEPARKMQKDFFRDHGTTLKGLMTLHNIDPEIYLDYVHDIDFTSLTPDEDLPDLIESLPGQKLVFTNADIPYAERVLAEIGLGGHFDGIYDIRKSGYIPKPAAAPYRAMIEEYDINPERACMVEDIARNLLPAAELGMETVWLTPSRDHAQFGAPVAAHIQHQFSAIIQDLKVWLREILKH